MIRDTAKKIARAIGLIDRVDDEVARRLEAKAAEDHERALRDPFRFESREAWAAYRRRHGLRTPRPRDLPRDPDREPFAALRRWE